MVLDYVCVCANVTTLENRQRVLETLSGICIDSLVVSNCVFIQRCFRKYRVYLKLKKIEDKGLHIILGKCLESFVNAAEYNRKQRSYRIFKNRVKTIYHVKRFNSIRDSVIRIQHMFRLSQKKYELLTAL